jgi:ribose/xylose/arabinose/galactoside ABC-type transport system permease subunit
VGSTLAAVSVVLARAAVSGHSAATSITLALTAGIVAGAINALFIAELRVPPIVTTLATLGIYRGLLLQWTGGEWVTDLSGWLASLGRLWAGYDLATVVAVVIALATAAVLRWTVWGRNIYRFGGSPLAAARAGISRRGVIYGVYIGMGLLTAVAGIFFAAQLGAVQGNAAVGYELSVIAAVVLGGASVAGGQGTVIGAVLGVFLLATIQAALIVLGVPTFWHGVVTGAMVLVGVAAGALQRRRDTTRLVPSEAAA